jgi:hypothetical protein
MPGNRPPIAQLGAISKMLEEAGYSKKDGTIIHRLEVALADRGKGTKSVKEKLQEMIVQRLAELQRQDWISAGTLMGDVHKARWDEIEWFEKHAEELLFGSD